MKSLAIGCVLMLGLTGANAGLVAAYPGPPDLAILQSFSRVHATARTSGDEFDTGPIAIPHSGDLSASVSFPTDWPAGYVDASVFLSASSLTTDVRLLTPTEN